MAHEGREERTPVVLFVFVDERGTSVCCVGPRAQWTDVISWEHLPRLYDRLHVRRTVTNSPDLQPPYGTCKLLPSSVADCSNAVHHADRAVAYARCFFSKRLSSRFDSLAALPPPFTFDDEEWRSWLC